MTESMRAYALLVAAAVTSCGPTTTATPIHGAHEPSFEIACHDFRECEAKVQEVCPGGHTLVGTTEGARDFELYDRDVHDAAYLHRPPPAPPPGSVAGNVVASCNTR